MPLELRGLQAWITCDDSELPQYQVEQDGDKSISCYIPSEAGKAFIIGFTGCGFYESDIVTQVSLDGKLADERMTRLEDLNEGAVVRGRAKGYTRYPFVFATVRTQDEEVSSSDDLSQLGTVEIKFYRVEEEKLDTYEPLETTTANFPRSEIRVPQTNRMAGYNYTILGEPVEATTLVGVSYTEIDDVNDPFCAFRFRHMPRENLQARGIIPANTQSESALDENPDALKKHEMKQEDKFSAQVKANLSEGGAEGRSNASDDARIWALEVASSPSTLQTSLDALLSSQQALQAVQDELRTTRAELGLKGTRTAGPSQCKIKRPLSPIRVGSFDGRIIDLTSD